MDSQIKLLIPRMSFTYQPSWEQQHYHDNTAITQDCPTFRLEMPASDIDPFLVGKSQLSNSYNGMTGFLPQLEKPYYHTAQDFLVGGTSPLPVLSHDQPCDPSSPEGSVNSDLSSMLDNDNFMAATSPHSHMLSRVNSAYSSDPGGFSRVNSRSSTFIGGSLWAPAFQGSGISYCPTTTSTLADIQGSPDPDMFKTEDDHYDDFDGIKMNVDCNLSRQPLGEMMGQHPTYTARYHNYSDNITLNGSPAPTLQTTIMSEDDYEDPSEPEYAEGEDNESDTDYRPYSARRATRRIIARRTTVSDTPKKSHITKSKPQPRRTSTNGSIKTITQISGERKYPCVFSFAGCKAMWKTKNEWKRHAMTQHLVLESYHCKLCKKDNDNGAANGKGKGKMGKSTSWANVGGVEGQVFNRKDLFTQHVKRMHEPTMFRQLGRGGGGGTGVKSKEFEEWIKCQQEKARFDTGRLALHESFCPKEGCKQSFGGRKGWDDRLEHIWKHFERGECNGTDMGDGGLKEWAVTNGVVENVGGRLLLKECTKEDKVCGEEDAPGDYE